jgi:hypothetical protein
MNPTKRLQDAVGKTIVKHVIVAGGGSPTDEILSQASQATIMQDALADVLTHLEEHGITHSQMAFIAECSYSAIVKFRKGQMVFSAVRAHEILARVGKWISQVSDVSPRRPRN